MLTNRKSLIIGKGEGISKYLSIKLGIKSVSSSEISKLNFSDFNNIIYTSTNPSHLVDSNNISSYIEKNFRNIYYILESNFKGKITYLSSVEAGAFQTKRVGYNNQIEKMYTPYSFSKFSLECLLLDQKSFETINILRLGLLWPANINSNISKAINKKPRDLSINLNSTYYITPYSLVLTFLKENFRGNTKENNFGYLMSSNKLKLSSLFDLRAIEYNKLKNHNYTYLTKEKDVNLPNLADGLDFNWENENDYEHHIGEVLRSNGSEIILPNKIS